MVSSSQLRMQPPYAHAADSRVIDEVAAKSPVKRGASKPASFGPEAHALRRAAHKTLNSVSQNIEGLPYNVAVAQLYELTHALSGTLDKSGEGLDWAVREAAELLTIIAGSDPAAAA